MFGRLSQRKAVQRLSGGGSKTPRIIDVIGFRRTSWKVPRSSKYTFWAWGGGGCSEVSGFPPYGGGPGSLCAKTATLQKDATYTLAISPGQVQYYNGSQTLLGPVVDTTVSGPGINMTAGSGNGRIVGTASGGDLNLSGSTQVNNDGGNAGTHALAPIPGGLGGPSTNSGFVGAMIGGFPGGGSGYSGNGNGLDMRGAEGVIIIVDETPA